MSRSRYLKPTFFTNERVGELTPLERLAWQGLWCQADREGRLKDSPKRLKVEILPYDDCDFEALLEGLQVAGFIVRYEAAHLAGELSLQLKQIRQELKSVRGELASQEVAGDLAPKDDTEQQDSTQA